MKAQIKISDISTIMLAGMQLLTQGKRNSPRFNGPIGGGKSVNVSLGAREISKEFGICGLMVRSMSTYDMPDVRGIMVPQRDENGQLISEFAYPDIMPRRRTFMVLSEAVQVYKEGKLMTTEQWHKYRDKHKLDVPPYGVVFLDEIDKASIDVNKTLTEFVWRGVVGDFTLSSSGHWLVVMAANRREDKSGSVRQQAWMTNRSPVYEARMDIDAQLKFMRDNGYPIITQAFAAAQTDTVFSPVVPDHDDPFSTPRSFCQGIEFMQQFLADPEDMSGLEQNRLAFNALKAWTGDAVAGAFAAFVRTAPELPDVKDVMKKPETTPVPQSLEARFISLFTLLQFIEDSEEPEVNAALIYIKRFDQRDIVAMAINALLAHDPAMIECTEVSGWVTENSKLITNVLHKL